MDAFNIRSSAADTDMSALLGLSTWRSLGFELPMTLAAETLRFASRRLAAQAEHLVALGQCGSIKDAMDLQSAFLTNAVSEYSAEADVMSQKLQTTIASRAA